MLTANCLKKTEGVCNYKTEWISIKDRKQVTFPVKTNCRFCYNTIYNSLPLCLFDQMDRLLCLKPSVLRLHFTTESLEEAEALLRQSVRCLENGQKEVMEAGTFTRGHFKRGVE